MQVPNPGEILLGKYRVEEVIGVGGMGRVVKASHMYLQQPVAIKILLPESADSQSTVARFLREAQATVRLRSEHIARVMDVGTLPDGAPFMVMEFLDGHDLNQILRHHGSQQPQAVVDLILQACEGMAEAHAMGIVHRDIKPSNFFITRRPDGSTLLKILDFGISKTPAELSEITGQQTVIGTPTYMAPEQMASAKQTDPRSDIWSIGVVMYQLLAGRPPFEAETYPQLVLMVSTATPSPLQVALPPGLQDIVFRCLEKDPSRRIQSVGDLARMLAPYASDPISAQHGAERASRILAAPRGGHAAPQFPGSAGGLAMTPPALTPKSWNKSDGSLPGGQLGPRVLRTSRGVVIGGVATLCIAAGIGGFFAVSSVKRSDKREETIELPASKQMKATVEPDPTPSEPANTATTVPTDSTPTAGSAAKVEPPTADAVKTEPPNQVDAVKTEPAKKAEPTKSSPKPSSKTSKPSSKVSKPSTTKSPPKPDKTPDDLFDDRK